ncbi:DUF3114 domain-containing protein [Streptococcus dentasini]
MVKMVLGSSDDQASSVASLVKNYIAGFNSLISAIDGLANADSLAGEAYTNAKTYGSTVITPLAKAYILLAEAAETDTKLLPDRYRSDVGEDELSDDTEILSAEIEALDSTISVNTSLLEGMASDDPNRTTAESAVNSDTAERDKRQKKLDKINAYDAASSGFFDDIPALESAVTTGLAQLQAGISSFNGTFTIPSAESLSWTETVNTTWDNRQFAKDYGIKRPEGMTNTEFQEYVSTLRTQTQTLESDGWTKKAIKDGYIAKVNSSYDPNSGKTIGAQLGEYLNDARTFGSETFQKMWGIDYQTAKNHKDSAAAEKLLGIAMKYTGMPGELDGSAEQTQAILDKMSDSLAPDDDFWDDFAGTVQVAYPDKKGANALGDKGGNEALKQKVHQFRYVISQQQVQYIRDWAIKEYGADQAERMTDRDKLAAYLKNSKDTQYTTTSESARLHNKGSYYDNEMHYPDNNEDQANYKVLIGKGHHSEFILDEDGNFVSELETENRTENDVINGSSFNYADFQQDKADEDDGPAKQKGYVSSHERLDMNTPKQWDPKFRSEKAEGYESPNKANKNDKDAASNYKDGTKYDYSYYNEDGFYSQNGKSSEERSQEYSADFAEQVGRDEGE